MATIRKPVASRQLVLPSMEDKANAQAASTFASNMSLPIHRWFRYSAGFSADWVRDLIENEKANGRRRVFDPFVGSGTTILAAEATNVESIGVEAHPFVARVARAKLRWREDPGEYYRCAMSILASAKARRPASRNPTPPLLSKCYPAEALTQLESLRLTIDAASDGSPNSSLAWLTLLAILRDCSPVGTAQWQYVLPRKSKSRAAAPFDAFEAMAAIIRDDMLRRQMQPGGPPAQLFQEDARQCASAPDGWADLVITSPPYANNYDYADATRLEMTFFGEIEGWSCLQNSVRRHLVRSCTQHVAPIKNDQAFLEDAALAPIRTELQEVYGKLSFEKGRHGGKKPYDTMIAAYFADLARVWRTLRRVVAADGLICLVIGDSAPYGVHVPVERWLGELALAAGFRTFEFEKTRDRNTKWKNRKHRVPLHEGRLWVKG